MKPTMLVLAAKLSNQELQERIRNLAGQEREATATLIAHLAVLEERGLHLAEGCATLFTYCTQILHYSEHAAYNRMEVARAVRRYPVILEWLASGSLNLTTVRLLAPALTPANHRNLLESARHKSTQEVREILAHVRPQEPAATIIRRLPAARASSDLALETKTAQPVTIALQQLSAPAVRPAIVPLAPERFKVQFTASAATCTKLRQVRDLLRHQIPDGDVGEIFDRALTLLLKEAIKEKCSATERPRKSNWAKDHSRHIPAEVKRQVWTRDGGQCAFVARNGRRCAEKAFLEFHHVEPYAANGKATVDNIQLRCRAHNAYEAELYFG